MIDKNTMSRDTIMYSICQKYSQTQHNMSDKHQLETNMKHVNLTTTSVSGLIVVVFDLKTYALDCFTTNLMEHIIQCAP